MQARRTCVYGRHVNPTGDERGGLLKHTQRKLKPVFVGVSKREKKS